MILAVCCIFVLATMVVDLAALPQPARGRFRSLAGAISHSASRETLGLVGRHLPTTKHKAFRAERRIINCRAAHLRGAGYKCRQASKSQPPSRSAAMPLHRCAANRAPDPSSDRSAIHGALRRPCGRPPARSMKEKVGSQRFHSSDRAAEIAPHPLELTTVVPQRLWAAPAVASLC